MSQDSFSHPNSKPENRRRKDAPRKKQPKKITSTYLHNAGLYYLERFAASSGHFREVMMRKIKKSCMAHPEQNIHECEEMLNALIEKFINVSLIDDNAYTKGMVNSLRRQGKSTKAIHAKLRSKRVAAQDIEQALTRLDTEQHENSAEAEFSAAMTFARKKRIGPFKGEKEIEPQKELARMARAGFSYDTSRRVLNVALSEYEEY